MVDGKKLAVLAHLLVENHVALHVGSPALGMEKDEIAAKRFPHKAAHAKIKVLAPAPELMEHFLKHALERLFSRVDSCSHVRGPCCTELLELRNKLRDPVLALL